MMNHVITANQPLHWLRVFYDTTSEKSRLLFFQPVMSKKRTILSLDQRIEVMFRLGETHHVEHLLPSHCVKTSFRVLGLQYLSCYVALILVFLTIAYIIMTMHVFSMNTAGGDSSRPR